MLRRAITVSTEIGLMMKRSSSPMDASKSAPRAAAITKMARLLLALTLPLVGGFKPCSRRALFGAPAVLCVPQASAATPPKPSSAASPKPSVAELKAALLAAIPATATGRPATNVTEPRCAAAVERAAAAAAITVHALGKDAAKDVAKEGAARRSRASSSSGDSNAGEKENSTSSGKTGPDGGATVDESYLHKVEEFPTLGGKGPDEGGGGEKEKAGEKAAWGSGENPWSKRAGRA